MKTILILLSLYNLSAAQTLKSWTCKEIIQNMSSPKAKVLQLAIKIVEKNADISDDSPSDDILLLSSFATATDNKEALKTLERFHSLKDQIKINLVKMYQTDALENITVLEIAQRITSEIINGYLCQDFPKLSSYNKIATRIAESRTQEILVDNFGYPTILEAEFSCIDLFQIAADNSKNPLSSVNSVARMLQGRGRNFRQMIKSINHIRPNTSNERILEIFKTALANGEACTIGNGTIYLKNVSEVRSIADAYARAGALSDPRP